MYRREVLGDARVTFAPSIAEHDLCTDDRAYSDRFQRIGNFEGHFHITTDPDVKPTVHAPWRCPVALKDDIEVELDMIEEIGVISRVSSPTDWGSSLLYTRKSSREPSNLPRPKLYQPSNQEFM